MCHKYRPAALVLAGVVAAVAGAAGVAHADVTIGEQVSFDFASIIRSHGTATEYTTADKQRRDSDVHCEGLMSMVCGNTQSGEIIRLDRELEWTLEPKKKEYRERHFLTAAERQAAQQEAQAMMEKVKQCPAMQHPTAGPDTSKCEMSPPKFDVKQPGTHATFAGHDAQLTQVAMTQSCRNAQTGDVCDLVFAFDTWLTQDQIAGLEDHKAFQQAYLKKLGLTDRNPMLQSQMRQFLAPYADSLKQLSGRAADLNGYPLKTSMRIAYGGEQCAASKGQAPSGSGGSSVADAGQAATDAAAGSAAGAAGSAAGTAASNAAGNNASGTILGSAASAFSSKFVGGLFTKKNNPEAAAAPTGAPAGAGAGALPPGTVQLAEITVETTSISAGAVPATQFDIPAGWKLIEPRPQKAAKEEFNCPKTGG